MANVRLERFGQGKVYPHEQTYPQAKEDRLNMLRATRANLSPIFGLYPDSENLIQEIVESKIMGVLGTDAVDHLGVRHRIWPISDLVTIQEVSSLIANLPMFVADGHHRYETACNYRDELLAAGELYGNHPANFVLTTLVSMSDPGLIVLPTHRLVHGVPRLTTEQLHERLGKYFDCESVAKGPQSAGAVWAELDRLDEQLIMALYSAESKEWTRISAKQEAMDRMAQLAPEYSSQWRELGVAVLHRLVLEDVLGLRCTKSKKSSTDSRAEVVVHRIIRSPRWSCLQASIKSKTFRSAMSVCQPRALIFILNLPQVWSSTRSNNSRKGQWNLWEGKDFYSSGFLVSWHS